MSKFIEMECKNAKSLIDIDQIFLIYIPHDDKKTIYIYFKGDQDSYYFTFNFPEQTRKIYERICDIKNNTRDEKNEK